MCWGQVIQLDWSDVSLNFVHTFSPSPPQHIRLASYGDPAESRSLTPGLHRNWTTLCILTVRSAFSASLHVPPKANLVKFWVISLSFISRPCSCFSSDDQNKNEWIQLPIIVPKISASCFLTFPPYCHDHLLFQARDSTNFGPQSCWQPVSACVFFSHFPYKLLNLDVIYSMSVLHKTACSLCLCFFPAPLSADCVCFLLKQEQACLWQSHIPVNAHQPTAPPFHCLRFISAL